MRLLRWLGIALVVIAAGVCLGQALLPTDILLTEKAAEAQRATRQHEYPAAPPD